MTRRLLTLLTLVAALAIAPAALAAEARTSLPDVEDEVMCVSCKVPLNVAESRQAYQQRELIRTLVDQGMTKAQVKDRLVVEYGPNVLAMPEEEGIGLVALLVPIAAVVALLGVLALLLPRWRRRARAGGPAVAAAGGPGITDAELRRLDDDLQRFDRG